MIRAEKFSNRYKLVQGEAITVRVVLGARVELAHPCGRWILSPLRLPVPPSEHVKSISGMQSKQYYTCRGDENQCEKESRVTIQLQEAGSHCEEPRDPACSGNLHSPSLEIFASLAMIPSAHGSPECDVTVDLSLTTSRCKPKIGRTGHTGPCLKEEGNSLRGFSRYEKR
jgi:hypothetical protein